MEMIVAGIFDTRGQFRQQTLLRIKDIPNSGSKCIRESALLKYIQVRPKLNVIGCIPAVHGRKVYSSIIDPKAEYIPLSADLKCKVCLLGESSCIV